MLKERKSLKENSMWKNPFAWAIVGSAVLLVVMALFALLYVVTKISFFLDICAVLGFCGMVLVCVYGLWVLILLYLDEKRRKKDRE